MSSRSLQKSLCAALLVTSALHALPACAATQGFDIPAQPLSKALTLYGRQAGVQIFFPSARIAGITSAEVKGSMPRDTALRRLIAGSGLEIKSDDGKTVILGMGEGAPQPQTAAADSDDIIVTGTREQAQTTFTALSPIDTFSSKTINSTVSSQLHETLAQLVPGFQVKKQPASDGPEFIRPASLDGLSADMTLVMVNGKRFHRSAFLNNSTGAQAADLAQIPTFGIDRLEVLRDGASAQYGTDAIAGVINIILDTKPGFSAYAQGSQYYHGDGAQGQFGGRAGFALKGGGHVVLTAEYAHSDATSRTNQRPDAISFAAANPGLSVPNPVQRWGNPSTTSLKFSLDAAKPITDSIEAYAFGTYGNGHGWSDINWRNPSSNSNLYNTSAAYPGFNLNTVYPAGFTPSEGVRYTDLQAVGGIRSTSKGDFTWDLSGSYGANGTNFYLNNSINASLGADSPHDFYLGRQVQREFNLNADGVYRLSTPLFAKPINIAFGAERRVESYSIRQGDYASYAVGPAASYGLAAGASGFPGFTPSQSGTWDQTSYAGYVDVQVPLTSKWTAEAALRDESYTSFGNTFNYKLATRYELTPAIAVRGSWSTGFKAPTPAQINSTSTSQGLDTTTLLLYTTGRLSPLNPVAQYFGGKALKPETSKTASFGSVWKTRFGLSGSVDLYQIDVDNRFSVSPTYTITSAIRQQLVAGGVAQAADYTSITFFTNDYNTRTRGVDLVLNYKHKVGPGQLDAGVAYSYTQTKVTRGTLATNTTQKILFEQGLPQHNATASIGYTLGKVSVLGRMRYYGAWTDSSGNATGDIFQRFGAITFFDASVSYAFTPKVSLRIGAENIFNKYPDQAIFQASRGLVYSRNAPYDTNGGNYYGRVEVKF
ncbi:TonB-dependent receptor [Novosphingobium terrae]|uniref:TonB-dependent receptor n=1 Tax=Novosphingobium terrae TaxID=2726189 RepID=UPI001F12D781|nr:TonB-dependent receptor [Novosphingobium terrae]